MEFRHANHQKDVVSLFQEDFKAQRNCDIGLICESKIIRAHRVILSLYSPFLKKLFEPSGSQNVNFAFINYKYSHIVELLRFMYTGILKVSKDDITGVTKCAEDLKIMTVIEYLKSTKLKQESESVKRKNSELDTTPNDVEAGDASVLDCKKIKSEDCNLQISRKNATLSTTVKEAIITRDESLKKVTTNVSTASPLPRPASSTSTCSSVKVNTTVKDTKPVEKSTQESSSDVEIISPPIVKSNESAQMTTKPSASKEKSVCGVVIEKVSEIKGNSSSNPESVKIIGNTIVTTIPRPSLSKPIAQSTPKSSSKDSNSEKSGDRRSSVTASGGPKPNKTIDKPAVKEGPTSDRKKKEDDARREREKQKEEDARREKERIREKEKEREREKEKEEDAKRERDRMREKEKERESEKEKERERERQKEEDAKRERDRMREKEKEREKQKEEDARREKEKEKPKENGLTKPNTPDVINSSSEAKKLAKKCSTCGKTYASDVRHMKQGDFQPKEPGKCHYYPQCVRPIKFRRQLLDHLKKDHNIDWCD